MGVEDNKRLVARAIAEVINGGNLDAVDGGRPHQQLSAHPAEPAAVRHPGGLPERLTSYEAGDVRRCHYLPCCRWIRLRSAPWTNVGRSSDTAGRRWPEPASAANRSRPPRVSEEQTRRRAQHARLLARALRGATAFVTAADT